MRLRVKVLLLAAAMECMCPRTLRGFTSPSANAAVGGQTRPSALALTGVSAPSQVAAYEKFEITFDVMNTVAKNFQLPYDAAPPAGVDLGDYSLQGISVDALFTPDAWRTVYRQPAFFWRQYANLGDGAGPSGGGRLGLYPTGVSAWKVRFTPDIAGKWQFRLTAVDASGAYSSAPRQFIVVSSGKSGFLRVGRLDPKYFEFGDGSPFFTPGLEARSSVRDPRSQIEEEFRELRKNKIRLLRVWISNLYGSAWLRWRGSRNIYDGYVPRAGILPFHDADRSRDVMTLHVRYPENWFDACYSDVGGPPEPVKRDTTYLISVTYWGKSIMGPRIRSHPDYGLVAKLAGPGAGDCSEPASGTVVSSYGLSTSEWKTIQGLWQSQSNDFLPGLSVALENVTEGQAFVASVSAREVLPDGGLGPEVLDEPSMQYEVYFHDRALQQMDDYVELAEEYGVFLKVVLMEKNDQIYRKLRDDGAFVIGGESDNLDGFYGLGRRLNKTRWLQRAWWRYVTARWGYSTSIHSWELLNEGDPFSVRHWEMADEFGKFMHCEVFGVDVRSGDSAPCAYQHPNRHLVTTSFWHSFPGYSPRTGVGFWGSPKYPNLDYADVHAYIATSPAPEEAKAAMETDAAYYHLWHSREYGSWKLNFPIVRGEAGMVPWQGSTDDYAGLGLARDVEGVWYHNYLWSCLDSGALYEIYWHVVPHVYSPGIYDHRPAALALGKFMEDVPLNNGHYEDVAAEVSCVDLRVVGQKDIANGRAYLWVQNKAHTWRRVSDGANVTPVSGSIRIGGFVPGRYYRLEWWDTHPAAEQILSTASVRSGGDGAVTIAVEHLATDVALKITLASGQ